MRYGIYEKAQVLLILVIVPWLVHMWRMSAIKNKEERRRQTHVKDQDAGVNALTDQGSHSNLRLV